MSSLKFHVRSLGMIILLLGYHSSYGLEISNISFGIASYKYEEPSVMNIQGYFYELAYTLRGKLGKDYLYRLELEAAFGDTDYNGSVVSFTTGNQTPVTAQSQDLVGDGRGFFEIPFFYSRWDGVIAAGFGYRYLSNKIDSSAAYLREQTYLYVPIGLILDRRIKSKYRLSFGAEYDFLIKGFNVSHISGPINFNQDHGNGLRATVGFAFDWYSLPWNIDIIYRYWYVDDSTSSAVVVNSQTFSFKEPFNNTQSLGLRVGISY